MVSLPLLAVAATVPRILVQNDPAVTAVGNRPWSSLIPAAALFVEAVRVCSLTYEIDSVDSGAVRLSKTPLNIRWYRETAAGVEASVIVGTQTQVIYVAFRGTDGEAEDTVADSKFRRVPFSLPGLADKKLGTVHKGWLAILAEVVPSLDAALQSAIETYPGYDVHFVGHSLGGALAHLYGLYAAKTFLSDARVRVLTVGQPRVGDADFSKSVEETPNLAVFRLVHEDGTSHFDLPTHSGKIPSFLSNVCCSCFGRLHCPSASGHDHGLQPRGPPDHDPARSHSGVLLAERGSSRVGVRGRAAVRLEAHPVGPARVAPQVSRRHRQGRARPRAVELRQVDRQSHPGRDLPHRVPDQVRGTSGDGWTPDSVRSKEERLVLASHLVHIDFVSSRYAFDD
jgi:Lipase (class 3)